MDVRRKKKRVRWVGECLPNGVSFLSCALDGSDDQLKDGEREGEHLSH